MLTHFVAWLLADWHNYIDMNYQNNYRYEEAFQNLIENIGTWSFVLLGVCFIILIKAVLNRK